MGSSSFIYEFLTKSAIIQAVFAVVSVFILMGLSEIYTGPSYGTYPIAFYFFSVYCYRNATENTFVSFLGNVWVPSVVICLFSVVAYGVLWDWVVATLFALLVCNVKQVETVFKVPGVVQNRIVDILMQTNGKLGKVVISGENGDSPDDILGMYEATNKDEEYR